MYLKEGHRLHNGKYQLLNILGEGGFSLTYRGAWKTEVQGALRKIPTLAPVCIKEYFFKDFCLRNPITHFVETNSETGKEIFGKNKEKIIKEAQILSEIHHPNVVNVLEVFKQNNTVYIVMEFISGHSLKQEVEQNGVFSEDKLKNIIFKIGQALDYIHEKNILHLDIKPNNILINDNEIPKLIDFGISKRYDLSDDQETSTTLLAASKGYASVEQYDSDGMQVFSPRPDIYSLGATIYYLLTGQVPTESILRPTKGLQNPRELNPKISENTERVMLKAMALNAGDRYATVLEMLLDLGYDPAKDKIDLKQFFDSEEDNTDLIERMGKEIYDADSEDKTVINPQITDNTRSEKKIFTFAFIIATVIVLTISAFILALNKQTNKPVTATPTVNSTPTTNGTGNTSNVPETVHPENPTDPPIAAQPAEGKKLNTEPEENNVREKNDALLNDALQAFVRKDYKEAHQFFKEALSHNETTEIKQYIAMCEQELEKIEIEKKKNNYDIKMKFGNFDVVRKKLDGLFGAIDEKGNEVIPCVYINQALKGNNRLFQRTDNLYDLYAPSGALLKAGTDGSE
ncbi:MAG: serine/threonine protein kinase [Candidatus Symbiothrix sp.]|jgi:serine/threonine-protein kinase|nr:serine/threonine protein kinase [Candidatus Symbiothrix sp.]